MPDCPVCGCTQAKALNGKNFEYSLDCPVCGAFSMTRRLADDFSQIVGKRGSVECAILSHAIRKMQGNNTVRILLTTETVDDILRDARLPSPAEQADNLVMWLGDKTVNNAGSQTTVSCELHQAIVGARDDVGVGFILRSLLDRHLIEGVSKDNINIYMDRAPNVMLSMDGWLRYETLKRGKSDSRKVFMAMQYGNDELNSVFKDCFKPAVEKTGFNLAKLEDVPRAGLIDDHLRVEIRLSLFLIADLTHNNLGAYWEAGYAEGLGKQVIYTCKKSVFEEKKTHFDTNHHLTVVWEHDKLSEAEQRLKDTIRATFPADAKFQD